MSRKQHILADAPAEGVVTLEPEQGVVSTATTKDISPSRPEQDVVPNGARYRTRLTRLSCASDEQKP
jgi:hypothetical protein